MYKNFMNEEEKPQNLEHPTMRRSATYVLVQCDSTF